MFWGKNMSNNRVFSIIVCICQQIKDHQYGTEAYCERPRVLYATVMISVSWARIVPRKGFNYVTLGKP